MKEKLTIPETITVHMGNPDSDAADITVNFPDYIKNVVSSEIYPTWPEAALRANIHAIVTFALNRIYNQWYRSRGYDFDITSNPEYDMSYIEGRNIYQNISEITDDIFNEYISRNNSDEPIFPEFSDGNEKTCDGLLQWNSTVLANEGHSPYSILERYYGDDIDIKSTAADVSNSLPKEISLTDGSSGERVLMLQQRLNCVSRYYTDIPKIPALNALYDKVTADAVRKFQRIFRLPVNAITDTATWYRIAYIYSNIRRMEEFFRKKDGALGAIRQHPGKLSQGDEGAAVRALQYILSILGMFYDTILPVDISGIYDHATTAALRSFQKTHGLPVTGVMDRVTWQELMRAYIPLEDILSSAGQGAAVRYQGKAMGEGMRSEHVRTLQKYLAYIRNTYPDIPAVTPTGYFGPLTRAAVTAFQKRFGLTPNGLVNEDVWEAVAGVYSELNSGFDKRPHQYPGYIIRVE